MGIQRISKKQFLPISIEEAWDFFSAPGNLKIITPDYMDFKILYGGESPIYPGQIIAYTVKPVLNLPMQWITEISEVEEGKYFIDNQISGPYKLWHHKHFFQPRGNGVEVIDIVDYILPFGILGGIAHYTFVKNKLEAIFNYRKEKLNELFGRRNMGHLSLIWNAN